MRVGLTFWGRARAMRLRASSNCESCAAGSCFSCNRMREERKTHTSSAQPWSAVRSQKLRSPNLPPRRPRVWLHARLCQLLGMKRQSCKRHLRAGVAPHRHHRKCRRARGRFARDHKPRVLEPTWLRGKRCRPTVQTHRTNAEAAEQFPREPTIAPGLPLPMSPLAAGATAVSLAQHRLKRSVVLATTMAPL